MRILAKLLTLSSAVTLSSAAGVCTDNPIPTDAADFGEPEWKAIIEIAFPPWDTADDYECPRLDKVGGTLVGANVAFPQAMANKFNPCYYTKAFAGLDPIKGGYPTPIDTKYPYEFAAPFLKQPGDGSVHHCPFNADASTKIQDCPKLQADCPDGNKDCIALSVDFGIEHIPPFVPLAAVKNAYKNCDEDVCAWFHDTINPCSIQKSVLDRLVFDNFGNETSATISWTPPEILDNLPATDPKSTYYKLEYAHDLFGCADDNCRGPHYCSKEAADEDIWGDFCPYIHTGVNSGQYRHPHIALAALELWIANKCRPEACPSTWLDSHNGLAFKSRSIPTSITWAEMDDNNDQMSQPKVPYKWPNSGEGLFPGLELYQGRQIRNAVGSYVNEVVGVDSTLAPTSAPTDKPTSGAFMKSASIVGVTATFAAFILSLI